MEFRLNQKVRVAKNIKDDGTCACNGGSRGKTVAEEGMTGYVCDITEFLFEPVVVVHFLDTNKKIGFRKKELEIVEDFNPDTMEWMKVS